MGKKSGAKVQESQNERVLSEVALAKSERYKSLYQPVEKDFIEQSQRDASPLLQGRGQADIAQASGNSIGAAIQTGSGGAGDLGATAASLGDARITSVTGANKTAQDLRDSGAISALKIGSDMSADTQSGMAAAARASNSEAIAKAKAQNVVNDSKLKALGQITMGGVQGKLHRDGLKSQQAFQDKLTLGAQPPRGVDTYRRTTR